MGFAEEIWPIPRVTIDLPSWQAIMEYTRQCDVEINGFGLVDYQPSSGLIRLSDAFITKQDASMQGVEIDDADLHRHMYALSKKGIAPSRVKFQWHSHVGMPVYFSDIDTQNIDRWSGDLLVSLVVNKHGEWRCRLDLYTPLRLSFDIQLEIEWPVASELLQQQVAADMSEKVTKQKRPSWQRSRRLAL
jgi:proteasome lid subunit RPN8/RPN11